MPGFRPRAGKMLDCDEPNWKPLEDALDFRQIDRFMWMFAVLLTDGTRVHAYKHSDTRRYLHLGDDGRAFHYTERGLYKPSDLEDDIYIVLPKRWEWLEIGGYEPERIRGFGDWDVQYDEEYDDGAQDDHAA